jgi:hypothetical protein
MSYYCSDTWTWSGHLPETLPLPPTVGRYTLFFLSVPWYPCLSVLVLDITPIRSMESNLSTPFLPHRPEPFHGIHAYPFHGICLFYLGMVYVPTDTGFLTYPHRGVHTYPHLSVRILETNPILTMESNLSIPWSPHLSDPIRPLPGIRTYPYHGIHAYPSISWNLLRP